MKLSKILSFVKKNIPTILAAFGGGALVSSLYLAIEEGKKSDDEEKNFTPSIVLGACSYALFWASNYMHLKNYYFILAECAVLEQKYSLLKQATGVALPAAANKLIDRGEKKHTFCDSLSGVTFESDWKTIMEANIRINEDYQFNTFAYVTDYYSYIGKDFPIDNYHGLDSGWKMAWDMQTLFEQWDCSVGIPIDYIPTTFEDGSSGYIIDFPIKPQPFNKVLGGIER